MNLKPALVVIGLAILEPRSCWPWSRLAAPVRTPATDRPLDAGGRDRDGDRERRGQLERRDQGSGGDPESESGGEAQAPASSAPIQAPAPSPSAPRRPHGTRCRAAVKESRIGSATAIRIRTGLAGSCKAESNTYSAPVRQICP